MKYYIAYGSNLSVEQMQLRCPSAVPIGTSVLNGWKLQFRFHATIEPKEGASVPVGIWRITDEDEDNMDMYEGYPLYYDKQNLEVTVNHFNGKAVNITAMVYVMRPGHRIAPPSGLYYRGICEGYNDFGLDTEPLKRARNEAYDEFWRTTYSITDYEESLEVE